MPFCLLIIFSAGWRHFLNLLFLIFLGNILGKVRNHAIRVEFQVRENPDIHSFFQILHAPVLHKNNVDEYVRFVDFTTKSFVPNKVTYLRFFQLVTTCEVHSHSRSCRKYKSGEWRYCFRKFFRENIILATPLPSGQSDEIKNSILSERERLLSKVK